MAQGKNGKANPKPKAKYTDKAQSKRFIEAARTVGADAEEASKALDMAVKIIVRQN
jgi:hypothetical protein